MKFIHPEFLFGLFAIAIPIIIHLFNFRKAKKVYFSNTRFIQEVKKTSSAKRKLKHLLVLISRILFITFLVLAFAQPLIPASENTASVEDVMIYVDNSKSMSNRIDDNTRGVDEALSVVENIMEIYPANTNYKLLTNNFAPYSNTLKNKDQLNELITEIELSDHTRSFNEYYSRLTTHISPDMGEQDVYIISDFQQSTFGQVNPGIIDNLQNIYLVPIAYEDYNNVMLDTVYLSNPFVMESEQNNLHIALRNTGNQPVDDIGLKLFVNDIQAATSTISLGPKSAESIEIGLNMPLQSTNKVRISIEEFPVTFDNEFYLVINKSQKINVLEVSDTAATSPIEVVFGNEDLFQFTFQSAGNLDYSLIGNTDLLVINGVSQIDNTLQEVVGEYRAEGGYLLVIPPPDPDLISYRGWLESSLQPSDGQEKVSAAMPEENDPFFENIFQSRDEQFDMPVARPVWQWSGERYNLLRLRNNQRMLSELDENTFVLSSPLREEYTNFHRHALFVPVMYRMAILSKETSNPLYYPVSNPVISHSVSAPRSEMVYKLVSGDEELIPAQRMNGNELVLELPRHMISPGFYDLVREDSVMGKLAFNLGKEESILTVIPEEELKEIFSLNENVTIFERLANTDVIDEIKKEKFGTPLWKYALILALLFLLIEILLIRFLK